MKSGSILLLLVSVAAGYVLYPVALPIMENAGVVSKAELPEEGKLVELVQVEDVDLTGVIPEDFPAEVQLLVPVKLPLPGEQTMKLKKGAMVEPVRLDGDNLVFKPKAVSVNAKIPIDDTNFKVLIKPILEAKLRKEAEVNEETVVQDNKDKEEANAPEQVSESEPKSELESQPQPEPEPQPEPQPEPKANQLSESEIVELMKNSISSGVVREFKPSEVLSWELNGTEIIDDKEYQIGWVTYSTETIFGLQEMHAKALIFEGKIEKWVCPQTGLEIH